ncbi:MAG: hypothetical protein JXA25_11000 [Anaerolineales bacterium]|nr:hypothetical protein [Anaerolineales bacterium]
MKNASRLVLIFIVLSGLITSCSQGSTAGSGVISVNILEPLDGEEVNAGDLITVRTEVNAPAGVSRFDLIVNGELARTDVLSEPLTQGSVIQAWRPETEGVYEIFVAALIGENYAPSDGISIHVGSTSESPISSPVTLTAILDLTETATPDLPETPTPTGTVTPEPEDPMVKTVTTSNCRTGDDVAFSVQVSLGAGDLAPIIGRNLHTTWWFINWSGFYCWVSDDIVEVTGDTSNVPVVASPPTPTPTVKPISAPGSLSPTGTVNCADTTAGVLLSWSAVSHPDGIRGYEWILDAGGYTQSGSTDTNQVSVHSIGCFNTYTWKVRAIGMDGTPGPYSIEGEFTVE